MKEAENLLESRGVKPTSNRIIVLDTLLHADHPVSLNDLEGIIQTMDKSSIFRALSVFLSSDIVHGIEDGSGSLKYEVCHGPGHCSVADQHVHFYCEVCHSLTCFEDLRIPAVELPVGFNVHSVNYMVKGMCPKCSKIPSHKK